MCFIFLIVKHTKKHIYRIFDLTPRATRPNVWVYPTRGHL